MNWLCKSHPLLRFEVYSREGDSFLRNAVTRIGGFTKNDKGATAVEFGLIAVPFFLLISMWLELGLTLFQQTLLDNAVRKESRLIRTGQITSSGATTFAANLCSDVQALMSCSGIQVNVKSAATFAALSSAVPSNASSQMTATGFAPGSSGQDVLVQVGYTRNIVVPLASQFLGKNGTLLIYSTIAFRNEPF